MSVHTLATQWVEQPPSSAPVLGGLGCGGLELWADGVFRNPAFFNNKLWAGWTHPTAPEPPAFGVEDLCFLVRVARPGREPVFRFLFAGNGYAWLSWEHMPRDYKWATIPSMPRVSQRAEFPFVVQTFYDDTLPIAIELTAFSPFVPHDVEASSLPGFLVDVQVRSLSDEPLEVSVVATASNVCGYDQLPRCEPVHRLLHLSSGLAVGMSCGEPGRATSGELSLAAQQAPGQRVTALQANPWLENVIYPLRRVGHLDGELHLSRLAREEYRDRATPGPQRDRCWVCVDQALSPRAVASMRFAYAWFFPNHQSGRGMPIRPFYSARFTGAPAVAQHLLDGADDFRTRSRAFTEAITGADCDPHLALALLDQSSVLTASSWLDETGHLFVWEGTGHAGMNTVDVDHYGGWGLSVLFPTLRAGVIDRIGEAQRDDGHIPHAFVLDVDPHTIPKAEYERWDVHAHYVLGLWRDWRLTADAGLLARHWPRAQAAMQRLAALNELGTGLPCTAGGITYDHWHLEGIVTYVASLYLSACSAMVGLARSIGDMAAAERWAIARRQGSASAEALLWKQNRYLTVYRGNTQSQGPRVAADDMYQTSYRAPTSASAASVDTGLHTDALNGEATALLLGLPRNLAVERVRQHLALVVKRNHHADGRFLANGSCADGSFPDEWPLCQWENPWTGTEYFVAAHCFAEGLEQDGLRIIRQVYERHRDMGMRFDHGECGQRYSRALSIWAAWHAWLGLSIDAVDRALVVTPNALGRPLRAPLVTGTGWGHVNVTRTIRGSSLTLTLCSGQWDIARVRLPEDVSHTGKLGCLEVGQTLVIELEHAPL